MTKFTGLAMNEIPQLPKDADGPTFSAPWTARTFAMTMKLAQAAQFSWPEWVAIFSAELARGELGPHKPSADIDEYYECWLNALEKLLVAKGIVDADSLQVSFETTLTSWPEPEHTALREPIARLLPLD
jgi:nitrile hydratase accessory protein